VAGVKPGGRIIIEEPDIRNFRVKLLALGEKLALMRSHFLSPQQIFSLFDNEAMKRIVVDGWTAWLVIENRNN